MEHAIVSEIAGEVVGFASLRLFHYLGEDRPHAEVSELFVVEQVRQKGVGAELLSHIEGRARASGATGFSVLVDAENASALSLYRKQGMKPFSIALQKWLSKERPYGTSNE